MSSSDKPLCLLDERVSFLYPFYDAIEILFDNQGIHMALRNNLEVHLLKLNLEIVPQGHVNSLVVEQNLDSIIKWIQKADSFVEKTKRFIARGHPSVFTVAEDGTLYFKNRLVVPQSKPNLNLTPRVMKEAH